MEIGIYSFVENSPDPRTGQVISASQRLRNLPVVRRETTPAAV
jgi:hypothetical protein